VRTDPKDINTILECPKGVEEGAWKYEQLRQFCMELNGLAVLLQDECAPDTCPQMTATEQWIFLCAAHKNPKECSAIDYTRFAYDLLIYLFIIYSDTHLTTRLRSLTAVVTSAAE
jgi:hypothetical protein